MNDTRRDPGDGGPGAPRKRRHLRAVASLSGLVVAVTACGSGHAKALPTTVPTTPPTTAAPATTNTTLPPPTSPLTGLPSTAASADRPAVVVKIDNVDAARPQTGIGAADIVYEVEVEGGLSRLAAVFQSDYPQRVGPVRSGRLTDEGIVDDLNHPVLAFSGANAMFLPVLEAQPATVVNADNQPSQFYRVGSNEPHNLYVGVPGLAALSTTHSAPVPLFHYLGPGEAFTGAGVAPASAVSLAFPAASAAWTWNPATHLWQRDQNGTADVDSAGRQIAVPDVVVMFINYVTNGYATGEGLAAPAPIPDGIFTGSGQAWFFVDGKVVKGQWTRPSLTTPATFTDSAGAPIAIAPGQAWIEAMPNGSEPTVSP